MSYPPTNNFFDFDNDDDSFESTQAVSRLTPEETRSHTQWSKSLGKDSYTPTGNTVKKLKAGLYKLNFSQSVGVYLQHRTFKTDELFELPSPEVSEILNDIKTFWANREKYEAYKFIYKRGILMYGDPGNGKTGIINILIKHLINNMNGFVLTIGNIEELNFFIDISSALREIEPIRPLIVVIEDMDGITEGSNSAKSKLLNVLDGNLQIDNVVYIATTNFPEKLAHNITNRPSRFDRRYEIKPPSEEVRKVFIENKLVKEDLKKIDIDKWVNDTEGFSMAHIKELIVSHIIMGNSYDESLKHLKALKERPIIESSKSKMGF